MTFSDGSFVRHLNINNAIVRFFNSCMFYLVRDYKSTCVIWEAF